MFSPAAGPKALVAAERALLALISSLDAWAGPLKVLPAILEYCAWYVIVGTTCFAMLAIVRSIGVLTVPLRR